MCVRRALVPWALSYDYGRDLGAALSREFKLSELLEGGDVLKSLIPARRVEFKGGVLVVEPASEGGVPAHLLELFLRGLLDGFGCTRYVVSRRLDVVEVDVSECVSSEGRR